MKVFVKEIRAFMKDSRADAVVEATILFPIMIMIFAGLVLLSMYLPARASLQRSTQIAATAIATERADTWLFYDESSGGYYWKGDKSELDNVYVALIKSVTSGSGSGKAETIVRNLEKNSIASQEGELTVDYEIVNYIIYKEIIVTATRKIDVPVDLSFVKFPKTINLTVSSTAVVQNGDEFIRNMDIAVDFVEYLDKKLGISTSDAFKKVKTLSANLSSFLGI